MKQHITIDQWNEVKLLSPKIPHDMNIGQMIEFLLAYIPQLQFDFNGKRWAIESPDDDNFFASENELCDALWQAVKHELSGVGE